MTDSYSLEQLAALLGASFVGNPGHLISGVNTLDDASGSDLSFLANPRYVEAMKKSSAGAVCVDASSPIQEGKNYLICDNPSEAFQKIAELLLKATPPEAIAGIHPTAVIHPSAKIDPTASIGPYCTIDQNVVIGPHTTLVSHICIYHGVEIGSYCTVHAHCTIRERSRLGNRVILQPGVVIGSCGFGYIQDKQGKHVKLEQLGIVILEDDVEIGANTTIDRSRFKATIIKIGSKIDNLCQIGHNVEIGAHNVIAAQTGIAGSSKTGRYVMMGGQVGVGGHVALADSVLVAAKSGVSKSLSSGKYRGVPAVPLSEYNRQEIHVRRLAEYAERIKALEEKIPPPPPCS